MNDFDSLKQILNNNQNLNNETKKSILLVLQNMIDKNYPINFAKLNQEFTNLSIKEGKLNRKVIDYIDNTIIIDPEQIRFYDQDLAFTSIIIEMSRNNRDNGKLTEPISLGFNESYAISLTGVDGEARFLEEQVISRMIGKMIGDEALINLYFVGNMAEDLTKELIKIGCNEADIKELLMMINKNYESKEIR